MDVSKHLTLNTTWFKTNWGEPRMQDIINYLHQPVKVSGARTSPAIHKSSLSILVISVTFFGLTVTLIYYTSRRYRRTYRQTLNNLMCPVVNKKYNVNNHQVKNEQKN